MDPALGAVLSVGTLIEAAPFPAYRTVRRNMNPPADEGPLPGAGSVAGSGSVSPSRPMPLSSVSATFDGSPVIVTAAMASLKRKAAPRTASPVRSVCREPDVVPESGAFSVEAMPFRIRSRGSPVASATS